MEMRARGRADGGVYKHPWYSCASLAFSIVLFVKTLIADRVDRELREKTRLPTGRYRDGGMLDLKASISMAGDSMNLASHKE